MKRPYRLVDVFPAEGERAAGNPVAVVLDGEGLDTASMQRFANWMNLSETTFVVGATTPAASYRVRIFTPAEELPFAGHPTIGTAHAWAEANPDAAGTALVQECGIGIVPLRRGAAGGLAFAAPALRRAGDLEPAELSSFCAQLGLDPGRVVDSAWIDNGPGWVALLLDSVETVLAVRPRQVTGSLGVAALASPEAGYALEVRAFFRNGAITVEDPVTGSLNAGLAQWLLATGRLTAPYVAHQGTALGRAGRVHLDTDGDGEVWVGGRSMTLVSGEVDL